MVSSVVVSSVVSSVVVSVVVFSVVTIVVSSSVVETYSVVGTVVGSGSFVITEISAIEPTVVAAKPVTTEAPMAT